MDVVAADALVGIEDAAIGVAGEEGGDVGVAVEAVRALELVEKLRDAAVDLFVEHDVLDLVTGPHVLERRASGARVDEVDRVGEVRGVGRRTIGDDLGAQGLPQ